MRINDLFEEENIMKDFEKDFEPDYTNILNAARRIKHKRMPLYEHIIDTAIMERY